MGPQCHYEMCVAGTKEKYPTYLRTRQRGFCDTSGKNEMESSTLGLSDLGGGAWPICLASP